MMSFCQKKKRDCFNSIHAAVLIFIVTLSSCTTGPNQVYPAKIYFDLPGFLDEQVAQLYKDSFIVIKTTEINGNSDQHEMPWTDWRKELALFYASDINKPSFIGKYSVDSTAGDPAKVTVAYKATDPSLRTRLIEIIYTGDSVSLIHISNQSGNFLTSNNEELYYQPLKGYIIKSSQTMKFFGDTKFAIKGDIVKKKQHFF
jgi:hypothetical protein